MTLVPPTNRVGDDREDRPRMTTIKATCPTCGDVQLTPDDVLLMVCNHAPLSYYSFGCSTCGNEVRKPADEHVISLLLSGGVPAQVWSVPAEVLEPKTGPALTYDDLLDLALALTTTDLVAAAAAAPARSA
jgi:hypothetical protein